MTARQPASSSSRQVSHNDIYRELGAASQQIEDLESRSETHDHKLEECVNTLKAVVDRLASIEKTLDEIKVKVLAYDILKSNIRVATATAVGLITAGFGAVWAVFGDRILAFFRGQA